MDLFLYFVYFSNYKTHHAGTRMKVVSIRDVTGC